jgi:hypothetical protein
MDLFALNLISLSSDEGMFLPIVTFLVCTSNEAGGGKRHTKNAVFWDVAPCGSFKDRLSEELVASIFRVTKIL